MVNESTINTNPFFFFSLAHGQVLYIYSEQNELKHSLRKDEKALFSLTLQQDSDAITISTYGNFPILRKDSAQWRNISPGQDIKPGDLLSYGKYFLTAITENQFGVIHGDLFIHAPLLQETALAEVNIHDHLLECINFINFSSTEIYRKKFWFQIRNLSHPLSVNVTRVPPESSLSVSTPGLAIDLSSVPEYERERMEYLCIGTSIETIASFPIKILPANFARIATNNPVDLSSLAVFIQPYCPAIESIIYRYGTECKNSSQHPFETVRYLYDLFAHHYDFFYQIQEIYSPAPSFQRIRDIENLATHRDNSCSCAESSFLIGSCLENPGTQSRPLLIFTGQQQKRAYHVLIGIYNTVFPRIPKVVLSKDNLMEMISSGEIICVETTGFLCDTLRTPNKLNFDEAVNRGTRCITESLMCIGFDIKELRIRRTHPVLPRDMMLFSEETDHILHTARRIALECGSATLEISHLFLACVKKTAVLRNALQKELGEDGFDRFITAFMMSFKHKLQKSVDHIMITGNFLEARKKAALIAIQNKSGTIKEIDLFLAILEISKKSSAIRMRCLKAGLPIDPQKVESLQEYILSVIGLQYPQNFEPVIVTTDIL